jgi:hypothetical protein
MFIVVVCLGSALYTEFPDSELIQPIHDFVVRMLELLFEDWNLSGKSVGRNIQVSGCPSKCFNFNLCYFSDNFLFGQLSFQVSECLRLSLDLQEPRQEP